MTDGATVPIFYESRLPELHVLGQTIDQVFDRVFADRRGSIPARAGEPHRRGRASAGWGVYPRTGGGTVGNLDVTVEVDGLSPHGRGNPHEAMPPHNPARSIPARAGEPRRARKESSERAVYPRTGGGTAIGTCHLPFLRGLSPHGRGNPALSLALGERRRSIPAREGEPRSRSTPRGASAVYPRTGGGTDVVRVRVGDEAGLSPHGRGNRSMTVGTWGGHGSIPARAGEPTSSGAPGRRRKVYPRTGGGTLLQPLRRVGTVGLSPHGRGNRFPAGGARRRLRSIPARAGNRPRSNSAMIRSGSIPARAGEPRPTPPCGSSSGVYPRTGGGTGAVVATAVLDRGLSPHARGNPRTSARC